MSDFDEFLFTDPSEAIAGCDGRALEGFNLDGLYTSIHTVNIWDYNHRVPLISVVREQDLAIADAMVEVAVLSDGTTPATHPLKPLFRVVKIGEEIYPQIACFRDESKRDPDSADYADVKPETVIPFLLGLKNGMINEIAMNELIFAKAQFDGREAEGTNPPDIVTANATRIDHLIELSGNKQTALVVIHTTHKSGSKRDPYEDPHEWAKVLEHI